MSAKGKLQNSNILEYVKYKLSKDQIPNPYKAHFDNLLEYVSFLENYFEPNENCLK